LQLITSFVAGLVARIKNENEEGQTLVEYGLIIALLSIAAIVILTALGTEIVEVFNTVKNALGAATPATP
jgi:pilus assembly protein Flp/PilA